MTEKGIWDRMPTRMVHLNDGVLYYFAPTEDAWREEVKAQWDTLVEENRQLRESMESSVEEIKDKLYSAWYQAGIKQGGVLYGLELDRKKFADQIEAIKQSWKTMPSPHDERQFYEWEEIFEKILGETK